MFIYLFWHHSFGEALPVPAHLAARPGLQGDLAFVSVGAQFLFWEATPEECPETLDEKVFYF